MAAPAPATASPATIKGTERFRFGAIGLFFVKGGLGDEALLAGGFQVFRNTVSPEFAIGLAKPDKNRLFLVSAFPALR